MTASGLRFKAVARRRGAVVVALALLSATAACGSRLTRESLEAGARAELATPAAASGQTTSRGDDASELSSAPGVVAADTAVTSGAPDSADDASSAGGAPATGPSGGGSGVAAQRTCSGKGSTIVIGTVGQQTGLLGSYLATGIKAVQAWVSSVNARGGVNCHPVKYVVYDDGGDPSRHQALTQQLIERDGALAVVFADAPLSGNASVRYLTEKRIPVIGSEGASEWFSTNAMYFPQMAAGLDIPRYVYGTAGAVAVPRGLKRLASVGCVEATLCSTIAEKAHEWGPKFGMEVVYTTQTTIVQPDYTAVCQAAQERGAQTMVLSMDGNSNLRIARSCRGVNFRPLYATTSITMTTAQMLDPLMDGIVLASPTMPFFATSNKAIADFRSVMGRYAPGVEMGQGLLSGWTAAKLFEAATRNLSDPPTSEGILEGLWALRGEDLGGLTQPLDFPKDQPASREHVCWWIMEAKGGKFSSPNGFEPICQRG